MFGGGNPLSKQVAVGLLCLLRAKSRSGGVNLLSCQVANLQYGCLPFCAKPLHMTIQVEERSLAEIPVGPRIPLRLIACLIGPPGAWCGEGKPRVSWGNAIQTRVSSNAVPRHDHGDIPSTNPLQGNPLRVLTAMGMRRRKWTRTPTEGDAWGELRRANRG